MVRPSEQRQRQRCRVNATTEWIEHDFTRRSAKMWISKYHTLTTAFTITGLAKIHGFQHTNLPNFNHNQ